MNKRPLFFLIIIMAILNFFLFKNKKHNKNLQNVRRTYKRPKSFLAFFWHIPKSGGTSSDNFFSKSLFSDSPKLSIGDNSDLVMFDERLNGIEASETQINFSNDRCKKFFNKNKLCPNKLSMNYKNFKASLKYVHSPLLMETLSILKKHDFYSIPVVLLRHPLERFVSEYYYLKYSRHEKNFNTTNLFSSIEEYTLKGDYQRNWMVCQLTNCRNYIANEKNFEDAKKKFVEIFKVVGFLDNTEKFVTDCINVWNVSNEFKGELEHSNKGKIEKKKLTTMEKTLIENSLKYDIQLYNFVKEKFG